MKVNSLKLQALALLGAESFTTVKTNGKNSTVNKVTSPPFDFVKPDNVVYLSFTGNPAKNLSQVASIAPEYQGILNNVYKVGGLGNVAGEASVAFQEHGNMDFRTFVPYYAPDNKEAVGTMGFIKVRKPMFDPDTKLPKTWKKPKFVNGLPVYQDGKQVFEDAQAYEFVSEPIGYHLKKGEQFVIHETVKPGKEWDTGYKVLTDTGISGSVKAIDPTLAVTKDIPYKVFAIEGTGPAIKGSPTVYVVHTPGLADFSKAYGGTAYFGKTFDDYLYSIFSRASVDAIEKMNTKKFGNFNPGNFWLHDRQAFPAMMEISDRSQTNSYWRGIRVHGSYHNPGRNYQGHYTNPIDFFRINGTDRDLEELRKNPSDFQFILKMNKKLEDVRRGPSGKFAPEEILTKDELKRISDIFDPLYGEFKDELGHYNLCKIPVVAIKKNPFNFTAGTVSRTYGKEMKNPNTREIAYGLTSSFASTPTVDIVNGSTPANLKLGVIGDFGRNNGFTDEVKQGFTPLTTEVMKDKDKLFAAKQANKRWILDTIGAQNGDSEALTRLFFSQEQIDKKSSVLGSLSKYKDGDVLFIGWGRPDTQKGFPTTLQGFYEYFKNPDIPAETKVHAKLLVGAGPWPADADDWATIQKLIKDIQELEGGKYKENVCYLNGFFSNRIVACADYSNITSRYEPCGITPLESFAAGTPVISNNTGGSPDFIQSLAKGKTVTTETGFLTKNSYLVNPEVIGAKAGLTGKALDDARRIALGSENAECIEEAMEVFTARPEEYKNLMSNALASKINWHENALFNQGKSALQLYKERAWAIDMNNTALTGQARNISPLVSLKGFIKANFADCGDTTQISQNLKSPVQSGILSRIKNSLSNNIDKRFGAIFAVVLGLSAIACFAKRISANKSK